MNITVGMTSASLLHQHGDQGIVGDRRADDAEREREDPRDGDEMEEEAEIGEEEAEALRQHLAERQFHDRHDQLRSTFSPALCSAVPSASASRRAALPGLSGLGCESCGAQPCRKSTSKLAATRPDGRAKRSA